MLDIDWEEKKKPIQLQKEKAMASVSSPFSLPTSTWSPVSQFPSSTTSKAISIRTNHNVMCCLNHKHDPQTCFSAHEEHGATRREVIIGIGIGVSTFCFPGVVSNSNALAAENVEQQDFQTYADEVNKFKLSIPQGWEVGNGDPNGFKSITAFYPQEVSSSSNVSVVITGLGADFTRMESFGKVDAFADTLVSGLDRSWQRPPGVAAKLIDCNASNGFYYIEYTLQNPGESRKHLYSAIGMASNGWYNRLYTVTGQFIDEEAEKYSSKIVKAVKSFRFI